MTGRNMVNAMKIKKIPVAKRSPKYMRDFAEGTLLVADCKLPGNSLTPFETLPITKPTNLACISIRIKIIQVKRQLYKLKLIVEQ